MNQNSDLLPIIVIKDDINSEDNPTNNTEFYMITKSQMAKIHELWGPDSQITESQLFHVIQNYV